MSSKQKKRLSEAETRKKLLAGYEAFKSELAELTVNMSRTLLMITKKISEGDTNVHRQLHATTAMSERLTWLTAVIEFIERCGIFDPTMRSKDIRHELGRWHGRVVESLRKSAVEAGIPIHDIQVLVSRTKNEDLILPAGEKLRNKLGGSHTRLMKDVAVIGYIQQFDIVISSASRRN